MKITTKIRRAITSVIETQGLAEIDLSPGACSTCELAACCCSCLPAPE